MKNCSGDKVESQREKRKEISGGKKEERGWNSDESCLLGRRARWTIEAAGLVWIEWPTSNWFRRAWRYLHWYMLMYTVWGHNCEWVDQRILIIQATASWIWHIRHKSHIISLDTGFWNNIHKSRHLRSSWSSIVLLRGAKAHSFERLLEVSTQ